VTQLGDQETDEVDIHNVFDTIIDGRIYPNTDGGYLRYFCQPPADDDSYEVDTDIVAWLVENRWATTDGVHNLTVTDLGENEHGTTWYLLDILTAIHQHRAYPTDRFEQGTPSRRLYAYGPAPDSVGADDLADDPEFSVDPLVKLGWVEADDDLTPHLTDAGVHRLELFGLLAPAE
jgi:hypothetical protein